MLDGKAKPDISLVSIFENHINELAAGDRVSSSYLDVRYYPIRGSIHFFPRNKRTIERLNLLVGRARNWLPDEGETVDPKFWDQFNQSEQVTKEMDRIMKSRRITRWDITNGRRYSADEIHHEACEILGIELPNLITNCEKPIPYEVGELKENAA